MPYETYRAVDLLTVLGSHAHAHRRRYYSEGASGRKDIARNHFCSTQSPSLTYEVGPPGLLNYVQVHGIEASCLLL